MFGTALRAARRIALVLIAAGAMTMSLGGAANADIVLPGDPELLGDAQTVAIYPPPDGNNSYSCSLAAVVPNVERDPGSGGFREDGDGNSSCPQGAAVSMSLTSEIHLYTCVRGCSGALVGSPDSRTWPTGTTLNTHGKAPNGLTGYLRTVAQSRYTFNATIPSNFVLSKGCYRAETNQVICNAASEPVTTGPGVSGDS